MPSTPQAPAISERGDFARMSTAAPLWEGRRGQIANLWLYAYCAILSPFILLVLYAAWRAVHTFWHRYELLPDRLRITTGLYRPHIATFDVDFDTVQSVRVEGFRLYRLVNRGDVVLERGARKARARERRRRGTPGMVPAKPGKAAVFGPAWCAEDATTRGRRPSRKLPGAALWERGIQG